MDYPRIINGLCMDYPYLSIDDPWILHGLSMDHQWIILRLSMDYQWILRGGLVFNRLKAI